MSSKSSNITIFGSSIQWLGGSDKRSVWGTHIPHTFPIQWEAVRSYLEFPSHLIANLPVIILILCDVIFQAGIGYYSMFIVDHHTLYHTYFPIVIFHSLSLITDTVVGLS